MRPVISATVRADYQLQCLVHPLKGYVLGADGIKPGADGIRANAVDALPEDPLLSAPTFYVSRRTRSTVTCETGGKTHTSLG
jgi:hypothetical protein